jgi:hypothetical protein
VPAAWTPAPSSAASVSSRPSSPQSKAWLLAVHATSTPAQAGASAKRAGVRKKPDQRAWSDSGVSRLTKLTSASRSTGAMRRNGWRNASSASAGASIGKRCHRARRDCAQNRAPAGPYRAARSAAPR